MLRRPVLVGLGGGIGASRLWRELARVVPADELVFIANIAEDVTPYGLHVSPDIDTVLYALSGRQDFERGWGLWGETFRCMETLRGLGEDIWFNLGDQDLATHLLRTRMLADGATLTDVTMHLAGAMGLECRVLPPTNDPVATRVRTADGAELHYQEFLVRRGAVDEVAEVWHEGLSASAPTPETIEAIKQAELVVLAPSNPLASVVPIIDVPGVREALRGCAAPKVAVSPVVRGREVSGPGEQARARSRAALLASRGLEHRASAVASLYLDVIDVFVVDLRDRRSESEPMVASGVDTIFSDTLVHLPGSRSELTRALLNLRG